MIHTGTNQAFQQLTPTPEGLGVREPSTLETLLQQFEKANSENATNGDRLLSIANKLNTEPPSPEKPQSVSEKRYLTSGDGLIVSIEALISRYQDLINAHHYIISKLERLL